MKHTNRLFLAAAAAMLACGTAQAADYWFLKPNPALKPKVAAAPAEPAITLETGILPEGMEGKAYSFDLKTLTQVTAGPGISAAQYAVGGGTLPAGVSLSNDGLLAGTPTAVTAPEGASFTVVGTYVTKTGQQVYTIKVGESVLEVMQIAAGYNFSCAVTTSGAAKCWGSNGDGQLGNGTTTNSSVPEQVSGLTSGVSSISAGGYHSCAVVSGAAKCWGYGGSGQLGDGTTTSSRVPVQVVGLTSGVASVSAGSYHTCAVVSGAAKCWGHNGMSQLGNGTTTNSSVPEQVSGLTSGVSSISAGGYHSCAVVSGAAKCWGYGGSGQLGDGTTTSSRVPVQVVGLTSGVASVSAGSYHTCAVVSGAAKCWGLNGMGRLGNGATSNSLVPVTVKAGN